MYNYNGCFNEVSAEGNDVFFAGVKETISIQCI